MFSSVPELVARGVIHQMFPLHEQRILNQLMTSWVQAVCERQPLGGRETSYSSLVLMLMLMNEPSDFLSLLDDICDYFGVKIGMYFAWLGFYTNSMLYPAVIGFLLWILAESDQVDRGLFETVLSHLIYYLNDTRSLNQSQFLFWAHRPVRTSAVWSLPSSTLCGRRCSWSAGRGARPSWPTGGAPWTPLLSPWRSPGPSSG